MLNRISPPSQKDDEMHSTGTGRRGPGRPGATLLIACVFIAGVGAGLLVDSGSGHLSASSSMTGHPAYTSFQDAWNLVHDQYVLPEEIDDSELLYGASRGMVEALGDTGHSSFLDPAEAAAFKASLNGELIGIGVHLEFEEDFPEVFDPIPGSPAGDAGIEDGDMIVAINGLSTDRMSTSDVASNLRGAEGETVVLEIARPSDQSEFTVTLTRARIEIIPVEWAFLPGGLMLIRLNEFSDGAGAELRAALEIARERGSTGIVLDLRGNPGGLVSEARNVASEFMPEGNVLYLHEERDEAARPVRLKGNLGLALEIPLVVLVNNESASAAEIVAASLRDNERSELVGARTYGTATVVSSFDLDDGSIAAIGTALWKTPDGEFARNTGIAPTIPVEMPPGVDPIRFVAGTNLSEDFIEAAEDTQLIAAMAELAPTVEAGSHDL